ncbi:MAG: hypothetical protein GJ680_10505 [Alteromonadaceae bacterium]|nr:hypothetical protein [Alteromonadaceae bacterium]
MKLPGLKNIGRNSKQESANNNVGRSQTAQSAPPIVNRGRSNALTETSRSEHFNKAGINQVQAIDKDFSSVSQMKRSNAQVQNQLTSVSEMKRTSAQKREKTQAQQVTPKQREEISSALLAGRSKMHEKSEKRMENTYAKAYTQSQKTNEVSRTLGTLSGKLTRNVDTAEANRLAGKISSDVSGRVEKNNPKAFEAEKSAENYGRAATAVSTAGAIAGATSGLTGGASLALSAGTAVVSSGLNAKAAERANKSSSHYAANSDTSNKEGMNLLDAYVSKEKSREQKVESNKYKASAVTGLVSSGVGIGLDAGGLGSQAVSSLQGKQLFGNSGRVEAKVFDKANTVSTANSAAGVAADKAIGGKIDSHKNTKRGAHAEIAKIQIAQSMLNRGRKT